jgi:hypothetical protein
VAERNFKSFVDFKKYDKGWGHVREEYGNEVFRERLSESQ